LPVRYALIFENLKNLIRYRIYENINKLHNVWSKAIFEKKSHKNNSRGGPQQQQDPSNSKGVCCVKKATPANVGTEATRTLDAWSNRYLMGAAT
jgi:hypothetical protein